MRVRPGFLRHLVSPGLACALPCILAACGDASSFGRGAASGRSEAEVGASVRDSAGVTIVEHERIDLAAVPEWRVAPEPELDIGRLSGDPAYLLHEVFGALRRNDGSVVAIWDNRVRAFGPDGHVLWTQGTEGDGPGAYRGAYQLATVRGDSIVVWDARLFRFSVLSPDGVFARVVPVDLGLGARRMLGAAGAGAVFLLGADIEPNPDGIPERLYTQRYSVTGHVLDLEGARLHSWGPWVRSVGYFLSYAVDAAPWEAEVGIIPSRDGAPGLWLADAGAPVPELRLLRTGDAIERIVRWEADRTVTEADRDEYRRYYRELISEMEERERRRSHEALLEQMPWPDRFPAYDEVMTDDVGRLWVADYLRDDRVEEDDVQRWTIFSADGMRVLGRLAAPRRWASRTVRQIGEDWMLLLERDELEVEHLRVYRIETGREER